MCVRWYLALALTLFSSVCLKGDELSEELSRFQGHWIIQHAERDGKTLDETQRQGIHVSIDGTMFKIESKEGDEEATIKLLVAGKIGKLDLLPKDDPKAPACAIYKFEGPELTICWTRSGGKRPQDFTTSPAQAIRLFVLKKHK